MFNLFGSYRNTRINIDSANNGVGFSSIILYLYIVHLVFKILVVSGPIGSLRRLALAVSSEARYCTNETELIFIL